MSEHDDLPGLVDRVTAESGFSGVVRVDITAATAVDAATGFADRRWQIENTTTTRFGSASATKGFTALAAMSLVADGTIGLDDPVRPFLGDDLPEIDDGVTVRHLLGHRSGIGDYLDEEALGDVNDYVMPVPVHELTSAEAYLSVLGGHPQREAPGSTFRYNNGGYVVLALVIERAAGRPYHDLVHERVCEPASLSQTSFVRGDELPDDVAIGYLGADGLRTNVLHLPVVGVGDGGIVTTTGDMHRFWTALFDDRIVPEASRHAMTTPASVPAGGSERYGLGFWVHPTSDVPILEGMDAGISFRSLHDPVRALTMTVISNTSSGTWPIARELEAALGLR